jgi:hypothetical protein
LVFNNGMGMILWKAEKVIWMSQWCSKQENHTVLGLSPSFSNHRTTLPF